VTCRGASPRNKTLGLLEGILSEDAVNKAHSVRVKKKVAVDGLWPGICTLSDTQHECSLPVRLDTSSRSENS
jgi:hypothetical protein